MASHANGNGTKHRANGKNKRVARNGFPTKELSRQGRHLVDRADSSRFAPPGPFAGAERVGVGELVPQPHGGALRRGGTNKGGSGRPPDAFREFCRRMASGGKNRMRQLREVLADKNHPHFMAARRYVTEYGYGKPIQPVELGLEDTLAALLTRDTDPTL